MERSWRNRAPRFVRHRRRNRRGRPLAEFGFGVTSWRKKNDGIVETTTAPMPLAAVASSFDRKAEIEECAAPSAVNFRVLSAARNAGGLAVV